MAAGETVTCAGDRVALPDVAPLLGGYPRAYGLLMRGLLGGERHGKRWFVSAESVERQRVAQTTNADEHPPAAA
jgi:hypothetical protein